MKVFRANGSARRPVGMLGWILQRASAAVIFGIATFHLLTVHYTTPGEPISFSEASQRFGTGLYASLWLLLLAAVLFHALYGLRGILLDFVKVVNLRALDWALTFLGLLVFGAGVIFALPLILGRPLL